MQGRKWLTDRAVVRASFPAGTVVMTASSRAVPPAIRGSMVPSSCCNQGLAGTVRVALPTPTCVNRIPIRWLSGGRGTCSRRYAFAWSIPGTW
jgi:hypothetical protein